jgi:hypothetical protein
MSAEERREEYEEKIGPRRHTFGPNPQDNPVFYTRFHPLFFLVSTFVVAMAAALLSRGGLAAGAGEFVIRFALGTLIWAVIVLCCIPSGLRYVVGKRRLRAAAAQTRVNGFPAAARGQRGVFALTPHGVEFTGSGGGFTIPYADMVMAGQIPPDRLMWCLQGVDFRTHDGEWTEVRLIDAAPVLTACHEAGVKVIHCANAADPRVLFRNNEGRPA